MKFNNTQLTADSIIKTRNHFASIADNCINGAINKEFHVNDLDSYIQWKTQTKNDTLSGKCDHTFAFLQYAYFIQTGEMIALLN